MANNANLICKKLHENFNSLKRYYFPFNPEELPRNGIYILFEKGEKAHEGDRIVRIGTHTGKGQLASRLMQHFVMENKDRSIFRKNIGRAILNKNNDPFLKDWDVDRTTRLINQSFKIDRSKLKKTEDTVSKYIRENFSFVVISEKDVNERLKIESKIISSISKCTDCHPSASWLGNFSPKEKIRKSGLWLVNELWKEPFNEQELKNFI